MVRRTTTAPSPAASTELTEARMVVLRALAQQAVTVAGQRMTVRMRATVETLQLLAGTPRKRTAIPVTTDVRDDQPWVFPDFESDEQQVVRYLLLYLPMH